MILTALSVKTADTENTGVRTRLLGAHNDWFVPGLYKNELRRTWSAGLLFAIILFFALPVLNLMVFSNRDNAFREYPERVLDYLENFFNTANPFITIYACLGGMLCAMVVAEYLYDRRKTNFVFSLPVKRQAYLLTKAASNLTWSVLAWIPSIILMALVALLTETMRPHIGLVLSGCFVLMAAWFCLHLYFFGLTTLACCFCGTGVMGGCMLLMLGGYVPITALSLLGLADMLFSRINTSYYLSAEFFSCISGVFRIFYRTASDKSIWFLLGSAAIGLVFTAVAVWLTVIRQGEKAGTPFAFDRVRDIVKYLLMGLAALLGGMLFEAMSAGGWSFIWMLFGCICGSVLCWMLCNTIFYKTPKMMFERRRGMVILTVCMMLFSGLARFDILGLDNYIPSTVMTNSIELQNRDMPLTVRDKSIIRMFNAMAKNGQAAYDKYGPAASYRYPTDKYLYEDETWTNAPMMIDIGCTVWKTNYLIPIAKNTDVLYSDWVQFVGALTAREDFADLYFEAAMDGLEQAERLNPNETFYARVYDTVSLLGTNGLNANGHLTAAQLRSVLEVYREEMRALGADALQQIYSGTFYFRLDGDYYEFPLYDAYDETVEAIRRVFSDAVMEYTDLTYDKTFGGAKVYYRGHVIDTLTEAELQTMVAEGIVSGAYNTYDTPLTLIDPNYAIEVEYHVKETESYHYAGETVYYDGSEIVHVSEAYEKPVGETSYNEYDEHVSAAFFWGCVPAEYQQ